MIYTITPYTQTRKITIVIYFYNIYIVRYETDCLGLFRSRLRLFVKYVLKNDNNKKKKNYSITRKNENVRLKIVRTHAFR